jgi:hypothetical protein
LLKESEEELDEGSGEGGEKMCEVANAENGEKIMVPCSAGKEGDEDDLALIADDMDG